MKKIFKKRFVLFVIIMIVTLGMSETAMAAQLAKVSMSLKQASKTSVILSWEKISGADGYEIYRKTGADGTYKKIRTVTGGDTLSYKNTGLSTGKKYYYKVRAFDKTSSGIKKGKYSSSKSVTMTYMKPSFTVYVPTSIDKTAGTIVISITNNSKSATTYFDGYFAIEDIRSGRLYNAYCAEFYKPSLDLRGTIEKGSRLLLRPGEKVRMTCVLDETFEYNRENVQVTTCLRYKQQDFVSVYSVEDKNKVFTAEEYYDYLMGA